MRFRFANLSVVSPTELGKNSLIIIASNIGKSNENGTLDDNEEDSEPHNNSKKYITVGFDRDYKPKSWKTFTLNIS